MVCGLPLRRQCGLACLVLTLLLLHGPIYFLWNFQPIWNAFLGLVLLCCLFLHPCILCDRHKLPLLHSSSSSCPLLLSTHSFPLLALHLFFPLWKCIFQRLSLPAFPHMAPFYFLNQTGVSEGIFVSQSTLHHSMPSKNSTQLIYYHMTFRVKRAGHEPDSAEVRTLDPCSRDSGLAARDRSRLQV